jgi:hypothetical protein
MRYFGFRFHVLVNYQSWHRGSREDSTVVAAFDIPIRIPQRLLRIVEATGKLSGCFEFGSTVCVITTDS